MVRLRNNKIQPIWFQYFGKNNGRKKVLIPSKGIIDLIDFIKPVSSGDIKSGLINLISEAEAKMMDAERDALSYMDNTK